MNARTRRLAARAGLAAALLGAALLGACAGARTTTAALGAIQDVAQSNVPALGYTVTYAVGNMVLIVWGVVIVLMMR